MTEAVAAGWQRLSPWSVVFLFVRGVLQFVRENVPVLLGAGAGVAVIERIGATEVVLALAALLLIAALLSLVYYRRFRFRLDDDVLLVQKGLFERTELKLSAGRIQHISLEQPAYMRPFDIVRFSAATPGGVTTELELPGIRRPLAESLRQALSSGGPVPDGDGAPAGTPSTEVVFRLGARGLTLHGLASNSVYLFAAFLAPVLQPLERLARQHLDTLGDSAGVRMVVESPWIAGSTILVGLVALLMLVSVVVAWLRFHGFTLVTEGDRYVQRSGLFNRQEQVLSARKLQSVEWVQTALGRLLGRGYLVCRQYGGLPRAADHAGQGFLIPGLGVAEGPALARVFWPQLALEGDYARVHPRYRRAMAVRFALVLLAVVGFVSASAGQPWWLLAALAVPPLAWTLGHLRWLAVGWRVHDDHAFIRTGLLGRRTSAFPLGNAQAIRLQQSWFQRRWGVATLQITLASGPERIPWVDLAEATALANRTLLHVEAPPGDHALQSGRD
ncbi:PH domain-containing protein [Aquisalimonas asiatica]|uniref:Serine/threonine protein kinase n=1 Tax=Aquisalimonas asiatica TaxID=406100 RepID=A0A1H8S353_9GAMM|nr:PH domain-containing protein [Aquisalimonas asiatica]SEO72603.1 serine/threonine protein kinase [Aquisalimonas asiatica]